MESWRRVWREGLAPGLSDKGLQALAEALRTDDPRLLQGNTTNPPPFSSVREWDVEGGCALAFCGWQGADCKTVGEAEEYFAAQCFECDQRVDAPAACRWFLNWFDETPRDEMRKQLLPEVERTLAERSSMQQDSTQRCNDGEMATGMA